MKAEMYKILLDVDNGNLTPEQVQTELLGLFSVTHRTSPNTYVGDDMKNCKLGLYEVFWKSGGSSIASIGNMHDGVRWVAPTNWTSESDPTGRLDDKMIASIERIVLLYVTQRPDKYCRTMNEAKNIRKPTKKAWSIADVSSSALYDALARLIGLNEVRPNQWVNEHGEYYALTKYGFKRYGSGLPS